jgi:hypothetical protein
MKIRIVILLSCVISHVAWTQYTQNDPLTRLGLGERVLSGNASLLSFGGPSMVALETGCFQLNNPASYSWMKETSFQASAMVSQSAVKQTTTSAPYYGGQVGEVAIGFRRGGKPWGFAVGMSDYSRVGYAVDQAFSVNDSVEGIKHQHGDGGIHQLTIGSSRMFHFFKDSTHYASHHLSLGINLHYMYGTIVHNRDLEFINSNMYNSRFTNSLRVRDVRAEAGIFYQFPIAGNKKSSSKKGMLLGNLAASVSPGTQVSTYISDFGINYYQYAGVDVTIDTGFASVDVHKQLSIPLQFAYSGGLSFYMKNGGYLGLAYSGCVQNWSDVSNQSIGWEELNALNRFHAQSISIDYSPLSAERSRNFFGLMRYRGGVTWTQDYLSSNSGNVVAASYQVGVAMPIRSSKSSTTIQLGYQWKQRKVVEENGLLVGQQSIMLGVQLHPFERWFIQRKYD